MKTTLVILALLLPVRLGLSIFAAEPKDKLKPGLDAITPEGMLAHIKVALLR